MSNKKKPFKETGVGKFLIEKAPSILGIVGDAILLVMLYLNLYQETKS